MAVAFAPQTGLQKYVQARHLGLLKLEFVAGEYFALVCAERSALGRGPIFSGGRNALGLRKLDFMAGAVLETRR